MKYLASLLFRSVLILRQAQVGRRCYEDFGFYANTCQLIRQLVPQSKRADYFARINRSMEKASLEAL